MQHPCRIHGNPIAALWQTLLSSLLDIPTNDKDIYIEIAHSIYSFTSKITTGFPDVSLFIIVVEAAKTSVIMDEVIKEGSFIS